MTIQEVISIVDDLMPNQYSKEQKIRWLSTLDGKIFTEVILTHAGAEYFPYDGYDSDDAELLVKPPYASDIYTAYLQSRIAAENNEMAKYDQYSTLFNAAYQDFTAFFNRTHMPIQRGRWRL
jgi:hypothetical protein